MYVYCILTLVLNTTLTLKRLSAPVDETAFVIGVRAIELALGVPGANVTLPVLLNDTIAFPAFEAAIPIIAKLSAKYDIGPFASLNISAILSAMLNVNVNVGGLGLQVGASVSAGVAGALSSFCGSQGWQQKPISTQCVISFIFFFVDNISMVS
jgi:hypothetical protein